MQFSTTFSYLLALFAVAGGVNAHGVLVAVKGSNGVTGQGFGVISSTPRNGTTRVPFQQDTSIIKDAEIKAGKASACGRTLAGGINNINDQLNAAVQAGLPAINEDGTVEFTLHQVNSDGAGPYYCAVSVDGGSTFKAMTVSTNVPGKAGISTAAHKDFPLVAKMPDGVQCTSGPHGDACIIRCKNGAPNGPFGGCAAVTNYSPNKYGHGHHPPPPPPYHKGSSSEHYHKTHSKHHHTTSSSDPYYTPSSSNAYYSSSSPNNYYTTSSKGNYYTTSSTPNAYYTSSSSNAYETSSSYCPAATVTVTETVTDCQATSTPAYGYGTTTSSAYKSYKTSDKCTHSSCKKQYVKRDSSEDSEPSGYDVEDADFDDVPLDVADRLLAADLERYRSRSKRLAERLERVKRMRVAGGLD